MQGSEHTLAEGIFIMQLHCLAHHQAVHMSEFFMHYCRLQVSLPQWWWQPSLSSLKNHLIDPSYYHCLLYNFRDSLTLLLGLLVRWSTEGGGCPVQLKSIITSIFCSFFLRNEEEKWQWVTSWPGGLGEVGCFYLGRISLLPFDTFLKGWRSLFCPGKRLASF